MSRVKEFHDSFYTTHLLPLDEQGNHFDKIASLIGDLLPQSKILDVGCGSGTVSGDFSKMGHSVYGLDVQDKAIELARSKGIKAQVYDFQEKGLPFEDNSMDLVLLLDVLEHLYDPLFTLTEARRVLKAGGRVLVSLPLHFDIIQRVRTLFGKGIVSYDNLNYGPEVASLVKAHNYDHIRFFTIHDVHVLVGEAGLKIVREEFAPTSLVVAFSSRNLLLRVVSKIIFNQWTCRMFPGLVAYNTKLILTK